MGKCSDLVLWFLTPFPLPSPYFNSNIQDETHPPSVSEPISVGNFILVRHIARLPDSRWSTCAHRAKKVLSGYSFAQQEPIDQSRLEKSGVITETYSPYTIAPASARFRNYRRNQTPPLN